MSHMFPSPDAGDQTTPEGSKAERWNQLYPVGTPVLAYPGCRPEDCPNDERLITHTRSAAQVLGGHTAVVWVDGHSACIALTHVDVDHARRTLGAEAGDRS